jgi:hypothetical protein
MLLPGGLGGGRGGGTGRELLLVRLLVIPLPKCGRKAPVPREGPSAATCTPGGGLGRA